MRLQASHPSKAPSLQWGTRPRNSLDHSLPALITGGPGISMVSWVLASGQGSWGSWNSVTLFSEKCWVSYPHLSSFFNPGAPQLSQSTRQTISHPLQRTKMPCHWPLVREPWPRVRESHSSPLPAGTLLGCGADIEALLQTDFLPSPCAACSTNSKSSIRRPHPLVKLVPSCHLWRGWVLPPRNFKGHRTC